MAAWVWVRTAASVRGTVDTASTGGLLSCDAESNAVAVATAVAVDVADEVLATVGGASCAVAPFEPSDGSVSAESSSMVVMWRRTVSYTHLTLPTTPYV